ncbi:MAG: thiamine-phosphate kinase [Cytophagales bacterium]|jgi:thiamine-monophosphate kinase|nr:thiamine-phosphate kinase [Cytophagales bacterium]MCA6387640.1 thiamine-phosphate kinase [Cytophagales bacterium]MCA6392103.1 thiamine-phosphate kinase [Cytophagales bacterium]MCA6393802.1 thiamine-phosphate kinase [Cytophagales bacterium]MCA6399664.1 thiamine-phosphate kinase [Cytophagales bacterium]
MTEKRTEITDLGEFGLIERVKSSFSLQNSTSISGIGDDAALIASGEEYLLVTTDMLLESVHFDLSYMPLQHLGYKAVVANVSDIAAMNGKPEQITVALAFSNRFSLEAIDSVYDGIRSACENYKVDLVGGDTSASASGLVISITALGRVSKGKETLRSTAKVNDIICVTGDLGAAYLGLQVLEREKQVFLTNPEMQPDLEKYEYLVGRQLRPEARMDIVHELADKKVVPTSMIDISDGLASELLHLSKSSGVGIKIFEDKVPIDAGAFETAIEFKIDPITCALNGGEDYELLFTIAPNDYEKLKNHPDIHFIGHVHNNPQQNVMVTKEETIVPLEAQGWNHFSKL